MAKKTDIKNLATLLAGTRPAFAAMSKALVNVGRAAQQISQAMNNQVLEICVFKEEAELRANKALFSALSQYTWPENHVFVHIKPPQALNIPSDPAEYHVGEHIDDRIFDMSDLGDVYWYNTLKNAVFKGKLDFQKAGKSTVPYLKWEVCDCPKYVVDLGNTNFPIGAFVPADFDITELLDANEINDAQLSTVMQNLPTNMLPRQKKKKGKDEKFVDFQDLLDSLPE